MRESIRRYDAAKAARRDELAAGDVARVGRSGFPHHQAATPLDRSMHLIGRG
jgi:hypothetical protein